MRFTALIAKVVLPGIFATPIILEMVEGYLLIMLVVFIGFLLGRWYQAGNRKNQAIEIPNAGVNPEESSDIASEPESPALLIPPLSRHRSKRLASDFVSRMLVTGEFSRTFVVNET